MKKLVYILPYLEQGGTESHVLELIKGFKDKYEIYLLAPPGPRLDEFTALNIKYLPFTNLNNNLIRGIKEFKEQLKKIRKLSVDIVHIHAAHELLFLSKRHLKNIPIIFTVHGYHGKFNYFDYFLSSWIASKKADMVITVSENEKKRLSRNGRLEPQKIQLIYNGISLAANYSADNIDREIKKRVENKNIVIGTVARLEKAKGIIYLIKAFAKLKNKDTHLLIIGTGSQKNKLLKEVNNLNIEKQITFTGFVNNVHDYFDSMDLFVLPSLQEPFGLVCAEAMAHKLPVIASNTGGIPELVKNNISGFIVPPADIKILKNKITKLIENTELRKSMGKEGYKRFNKYFKQDIFLEKTENIYFKFL